MLTFLRLLYLLCPEHLIIQAKIAIVNIFFPTETSQINKHKKWNYGEQAWGRETIQLSSSQLSCN